MSNHDKEEITRLVRGVKNGEENCLQKLFTLYYDPVHRFCTFMSDSDSLADEITQEAFIKAFNHIHQLQNEGNFQSWIFSIAKQLFLLHLRPKKNQAHASTDEIVETGYSPKELEYNNLIQKGLELLTEEEKQSLLLVAVAENSYEEAAKIMGMSFNSLHTTIKSAKKKFIEYCTENQLEVTGLFFVQEKKAQ